MESYTAVVYTTAGVYDYGVYTGVRPLIRTTRQLKTGTPSKSFPINVCTVQYCFYGFVNAFTVAMDTMADLHFLTPIFSGSHCHQLISSGPQIE